MKRNSKATAIIKGASKREGLSLVKLADLIGMNYFTLFKHVQNPEQFRIYELAAICNNVDFLEDEKEILRKELKIL